MTGHTLAIAELTEILERFAVERAGGRAAEEIVEAQTQLLLARIAALTEVLRGATPNDTAHLASRLLVSDLAGVAAQFRGRANGMRSLLAKALVDVRDGLDNSAADDRP